MDVWSAARVWLGVSRGAIFSGRKRDGAPLACQDQGALRFGPKEIPCPVFADNLPRDKFPIANQQFRTH